MSKNLGKKFGEYLIEELLGTGGFGSVYKVSKTDESGKYYYATKHITFPSTEEYNDILLSMNNVESDADEYFKTVLKDIVSEFSNMRELSNNNSKYFVTYYDHQILGSPKKYDVLIRMELLTPLNNYIKKNKLKVADVINIGFSIGNALKICHKKKIMHRDIKEANIFINNEGDYKLGDFGVARTLDKTTQMMSRKGTPFYMAPEILLNKKYSFNVDIYSLCMVLYKFLNNSRYPFMPAYPQKFTNADIENAQAEKVKGQKPALPCMAENILGEVIVKGLDNAQERYQNIEQFLDALQNAQQSLTAEYLESVISEPVDITSTQISGKKTSGVFEGETKAVAGLTKTNEKTFLTDNDKNDNDIFKEAKEEKVKAVKPTMTAETKDADKASKKIMPINYFNFIIPIITAIILGFYIDVTVRDLIVFNVKFFDSAYFRWPVIVISALATLFFVFKILIFPDKKTITLAGESKKWKQETLAFLNTLNEFILGKTSKDIEHKSYRNLKYEISDILSRVASCKSFWKMTNLARQYENKASDEIKIFNDLVMQNDFVKTLNDGNEFVTMPDSKKSELSLQSNKIKRLLEQREANLR